MNDMMRHLGYSQSQEALHIRTIRHTENGVSCCPGYFSLLVRCRTVEGVRTESQTPTG